MARVALERVSKIYPDGTRAVNEMSLDIVDGEFMVLVGPSGCGKTTALRMVAGLEDISEGVLTIGDRVVNHVPSRDRDIAMVFQSYALYPHLSVYENIAFGLRLRKMSKSEIDERVQRAAKLLGLEEYLKRKPRALSGGQRQRVAMGRAIVRQPAAFLMDEPLSNLDAKLRVQTRAEIAKLQADLGVTTIYVTHDQIEAMTMGDRVAVMRKGELQQVDDPQTLYDRPVNLFVGGFIGSPAMNMLDATIEQSNGDLRAKIGKQVVSLGAETLEHRPGLKAYAGKPVIIGIRPEDLEDAALVTGAPRRPDAARPPRAAGGARLGGHGAFRDRGRARRDGRDARARGGRRRGRRAADRRPGERGDHRGPVRRALEGRGGRGDHRRRRHAGAALLRSGNRKWHLRIDERGPSVRQNRVAVVLVAVIAIAAAAYGATSAASKPSKATGNAAVSGSISFDGIWTGVRGEGVRRRDQGVQQDLPEREGELQAGRQQRPDRAGHGDRRRPSPGHGGHRPARSRQAAGPAGPPEADHVREVGDRPELRACLVAARDRSAGKQYALVFKAANKSLLWYNVPAFKTAGVTPPKTWAQLTAAAKTLQASGTPAYSIGGADGWTLTDMFENIYLRTFGAAKYNALSAQQIKWTDPSVITALKTMAKVIGDIEQPRRRRVGRAPVRVQRLGHERVQHPAEGGDRVRG